MKIWKKSKLNCENIGEYGRKVSSLVKRYGKYKRKVS
jgi:hypothetical protein